LWSLSLKKPKRGLDKKGGNEKLREEKLEQLRKVFRRLLETYINVNGE